MKPQISVIMSVYNNRRHIGEAIDSILHQSLGGFEFLIIDDACTDGTSKILEYYKDKDSRIKIIRNKINIGLTRSLNIALDRAEGCFIARQDADDISVGERLERQIEYLKNNKDIFLVGCAATVIDDNGHELGINKVSVRPETIKQKLEKTNCLIHPSIVFRKEPGLRYREKAFYCEDYDFYLRLLLSGKILSNLPEILIKYRFVKNSISFSKSFYAGMFASKMREFYFQEKAGGRSGYDDFDPQSIFRIPVPADSTRLADERYINLMYELHNKNLLKQYSSSYLKKHGPINKILVYFLLSLMPARLISLIENFHNGKT